MSTELFSLHGQRVLITGGSRGLGFAMAKGLASAGAKVCIVARSREDVDAATAQLGNEAVGLAADVVEQSANHLVDLAEQHLEGPIDTVIHAAGIQHRQAAEDFSPEAWERVLQVNLTAPFLLSQEIGRRQLAAKRPGSHIFIGSLASTLSIQHVTAYTATKSGIVGVMRNLSTEWADRGIRSNAIGPGYFRTQMTEELFKDDVRYNKMLDRIPAKRFGNPEELAGAAIFLASPASSYVTGQLLMVDGGWTAR